ncbi:MAG: hypothetical protein LiPW30_697 [Parcubacteria group bacterium LiPW_30]|nr:MAG: hypothetical protein LiPW30_697 [Parcubacteria group bacterium LiPW_30]
MATVKITVHENKDLRYLFVMRQDILAPAPVATQGATVPAPVAAKGAITPIVSSCQDGEFNHPQTILNNYLADFKPIFSGLNKVKPEDRIPQNQDCEVNKVTKEDYYHRNIPDLLLLEKIGIFKPYHKETPQRRLFVGNSYKGVARIDSAPVDGQSKRYYGLSMDEGTSFKSWVVTNDDKARSGEILLLKNVDASTVEAAWLFYEMIIDPHKGVPILIISETPTDFNENIRRTTRDQNLDGGIQAIVEQALAEAVQLGIQYESYFAGLLFGGAYSDSHNVIDFATNPTEIFVRSLRDNAIPLTNLKQAFLSDDTENLGVHREATTCGIYFRDQSPQNHLLAKDCMAQMLYHLISLPGKRFFSQGKIIATYSDGLDIDLYDKLKKILEVNTGRTPKMVPEHTADAMFLALAAPLQETDYNHLLTHCGLYKFANLYPTKYHRPDTSSDRILGVDVLDIGGGTFDSCLMTFLLQDSKDVNGVKGNIQPVYQCGFSEPAVGGDFFIAFLEQLLLYKFMAVLSRTATLFRQFLTLMSGTECTFEKALATIDGKIIPFFDNAIALKQEILYFPDTDKPVYTEEGWDLLCNDNRKTLQYFTQLFKLIETHFSPSTESPYEKRLLTYRFLEPLVPSTDGLAKIGEKILYSTCRTSDVPATKLIYYLKLYLNKIASCLVRKFVFPVPGKDSKVVVAEADVKDKSYDTCIDNIAQALGQDENNRKSATDILKNLELLALPAKHLYHFSILPIFYCIHNGLRLIPADDEIQVLQDGGFQSNEVLPVRKRVLLCGQFSAFALWRKVLERCLGSLFKGEMDSEIVDPGEIVQKNQRLAGIYRKTTAAMGGLFFSVMNVPGERNFKIKDVAITPTLPFSLAAGETPDHRPNIFFPFGDKGKKQECKIQWVSANSGNWIYEQNKIPLWLSRVPDYGYGICLLVPPDVRWYLGAITGAPPETIQYSFTLERLEAGAIHDYSLIFQTHDDRDNIFQHLASVVRPRLEPAYLIKMSTDIIKINSPKIRPHETRPDKRAGSW